ncbi:hypothetical protein [Metapseudomonas otitidis]|uniref:hypothetical protein n=1 Tax=Metapseudomonas otitidis TaxID=319939 RepID=UPI00244D6AFB|nr:hypothetical protein [Pseudomonas otitidis]MDH0339076.1 class I SAM-dependent methyltransferase [Pseudomonas otitidis]
MSKLKPIMIHSLFRSGSTYIFNVFRQSSAGYCCYQEPLHEVFADHSPEAPWRAESNSEPRTSELRHPSLDRPYFWEFTRCADLIESRYRKEFAFDTFFLDQNDDTRSELCSYIEGLGERATGRPVYQFCRSIGRMAWLRQQFDAVHLHLWRNPWDQWWSYKIDRYFDDTLIQIYSAANLPQLLSWLREHPLSSALHYSGRESDDYRVGRDIPLILDPQQSYFLFYGLWVWGLLVSRDVAHEQINIDSLSTSPEYRKQLGDRLVDLGVNGLDFADANVSRMLFGDDDRVFFGQIEDIVHEHILANGFQQNDLEWVKQQRALHAPNGSMLPNSDPLASLRDLYRRVGALTKSFRTNGDTLSSELVDTKTALANLKNDLLNAQQKAQIAELQNIELKEQLATLENKLIDAQQIAQIANQQCIEVKALLAEVQSREHELLSSTSWRITAPLRRIRGRAIRLGKRGALSLLFKPIQAPNSMIASYTPTKSTSLSAPNPKILHLAAKERCKLFLAWLEANTFTQYDFDHKTRFWETYLRLNDYLEIGTQLLELGGESKITNYLKTQLGIAVDVYGQDLRYPFDLKTNGYDLILCLEVIEHIKDRTETGGINEIAMFTRSGVRNVYSESWRVLRDGGILFMTTPNACCIDSIARIFLYQSPQLYAPHVKEFSAIELIDLAKECGFELIAYSTANVWYPHPTIDRDRITSILRDANIPTEDRGDDMFLVFQKR